MTQQEDYIEQIQRVLRIKMIAAEHWGFKAMMIDGPIRRREVARMRQAAHYAARQYTTLSLPVLAREFNRDHTTLLHSIEVCERTLTKGGVSTGELKNPRPFQPELRTFISRVAATVGEVDIVSGHIEDLGGQLHRMTVYAKSLEKQLEEAVRQRDEFWRRLNDEPVDVRMPLNPHAIENVKLKKELKGLKEEIKIARAMSMGFGGGTKNQSLPG